MHRFRHPWIYGHPWGGGFSWWPEMLLSALIILFSVALFIWLAWALLRWIAPSIRPMLTNIFGMTPGYLSSLEILRQRYAAGEIDSDTFEHMWARLVASYQQESSGTLSGDCGYQEEHRTGYGSAYHSSASYGQGKVRTAEQEQFISEIDM